VTNVAKTKTTFLAILLALAVLVTAGAVLADVTFEILDIPGEADWANFSLSHSGRSMGCLLGGSVYWWTADDGFRFLDQGGLDMGFIDMSADGKALSASRSVDGASVPTTWYVDGTSIDLASLGDTNCRTTAVSTDGGSAVGFCEHPQGGYRQPALWVDGGTIRLFLGTDSPGEAHNISPDGHIVVGQALMGGLSPMAFYWTRETQAISLGNLSGRGTDPSLAKAVSDDGKIVGSSGDDLWGEQEAFIWTSDHGMLSLRRILGDHGVDVPQEIVLTSALDISGDGNTVVGVGRDKDWNQKYWRITLDGVVESTPIAGSDSTTTQEFRAANPDTFHSHQADFLHPFPFGKSRFGPFR